MNANERGTDESLEVTVCENGVVNVNRPNGSGRAHSVFVGADGGVVRCSCRGWKFNGECSHADAIAARPLVTASAQARAADTPTVATDGGQPEIEDVADDGHRARCTGCGRTGPKGLGDDDPAILHERDCPRADDRDESRGVVDPYADRVAEREAVDDTPL